MRTSKVIQTELTFTLLVAEVRTLRKVLAQVTQGVALSLDASDVTVIKEFNKELGAFWDALPRP